MNVTAKAALVERNTSQDTPSLLAPERELVNPPSSVTPPVTLRLPAAMTAADAQAEKYGVQFTGTAAPDPDWTPGNAASIPPQTRTFVTWINESTTMPLRREITERQAQRFKLPRRDILVLVQSKRRVTRIRDDEGRIVASVRSDSSWGPFGANRFSVSWRRGYEPLPGGSLLVSERRRFSGDQRWTRYTLTPRGPRRAIWTDLRAVWTDQFRYDTEDYIFVFRRKR